MKILVDKLPKDEKECPFNIPCKHDPSYPSVCKLKIGDVYEFGLSFGNGNWYNCSLCKKEECAFLKTIN